MRLCDVALSGLRQPNEEECDWIAGGPPKSSGGATPVNEGIDRSKDLVSSVMLTARGDRVDFLAQCAPPQPQLVIRLQVQLELLGRPEIPRREVLDAEGGVLEIFYETV